MPRRAWEKREFQLHIYSLIGNERPTAAQASAIVCKTEKGSMACRSPRLPPFLLSEEGHHTDFLSQAKTSKAYTILDKSSKPCLSGFREMTGQQTLTVAQSDRNQ